MSYINTMPGLVVLSGFLQVDDKPEDCARGGIYDSFNGHAECSSLQNPRPPFQ